MQDEIIESIRRFSVSDDPLSTSTAQTFVDAFAPLCYAQLSTTSDKAPSSSRNGVSAASKLKQARSTALLTLASRSSSATAPTLATKGASSPAERINENLAQLLTPVIRSRLADTTPHSLLSALHFFSALFSVLPTEAHVILTADGIIDLVLEAPDACNAVTRATSNSLPQLPSDQDLVSLAVAELISSASNSAASRKYLASQQAILDWLDINCLPRSSSSNAHAKPKSNAIAAVAGVAHIKVYRAVAAEAAQGLIQAVSSQPTSQQDHIRKIQEHKQERRRKDESLCQIVQAEMVAAASKQSASKAGSSSIQEILQAEYERTVKLSCLEVLAYLTAQPAFKQRVADDTKFLQILCTSFSVAQSMTSDDKQTLDIDCERFDGALQLSLATILSNITAYPPSLTPEEKQVRRLGNFANAQGNKQGDDQADKDELLEKAHAVEKRCIAVLEAKGVETISAIAVAGPPPTSSKFATNSQDFTSGWKVNPSKSVRRACGNFLLALVTKQDRTVRGKAVQQGALKAALALSAPVLHSLLSSGKPEPKQAANGLFSRASGSSGAEVTSEDLAPLQALAKLLISLNPSLLFPSHDGLLSVASVTCSLLLYPSASRLQKFEALLALTNLASLSPEVGLKIAAFSLDTTNGYQAQQASQPFHGTSVLAQACEQLLMEDHSMVRRAWIELLVNLVQVEEVLDFFLSTGTTNPCQAGNDSKQDIQSRGERQDRVSLRLRMLLALSEVDEWAYVNRVSPDQSGKASKSSSESAGGEPSLATRLACLAILAMVTESKAAMNALLTLERLFPVLLSNLLLDRSKDDERNEWERADLLPANVDARRDTVGLEADVQLNAINLNLRASYVLLNVLYHLKESCDGDGDGNGNGNDNDKLKGGFEKSAVLSALQETLGHHVVQLEKAAEPPHVEESRKGLLQVLAECLKLARDLNTV
ncbi:hypothetical protein NDA18_001503 [Ustilago nuda]|nr:hypothetical protein NDA18_001503 [Ustilago nuda]